MVCWSFVFKQKTAYDMRISDWSSDVCTSDLEALATGAEVERVRSLINDAVRQLGAACSEMDRHSRMQEQAVAGILAQNDGTSAGTDVRHFAETAVGLMSGLADALGQVRDRKSVV